MFFSENREHFFRPLYGKYREIIAECLRLLYQRLYTSMADYGHALNREQLLEVFQEALTRAPELQSDEHPSTETAETTESEQRFRSDRERANWILHQLVDHGWLEIQVDEISLQSSYQFSRYGRLFAQPLVELQGSSVRTRHRNTRNTRNALRAFLNDGEVYDLLDAYEYSERIISDFTDIITELEERKRQLVREVEAGSMAQRASDEFFDFMETRFQPDLSVRLSADSVEKHRDDIESLLLQIRRQPKEAKALAEKKLRQLLPDQIVPGQSLLWTLLDRIDTRLRNACDIMLPALRASLRNFTRRADIIIRQMSWLASQKNSDLVQVCEALSHVSDTEQAARLTRAGELLAGLNIQLPDPRQNVLREQRRKREVFTQVLDEGPLDPGARRDLYVQHALDQAFVIHDEQTRQYLLRALQQGERIETRHLQVHSAPDLLAATHAIELASASNLSSEYEFIVEPLEEQTRSEYLEQADNFSIQIRRKPPA
ncbi:MAG: flagellar protein FliT [Hahellaceae bacterium]|nr:flagellar protein FliT [Hahellaceae bacterium]